MTPIDILKEIELILNDTEAQARCLRLLLEEKELDHDVGLFLRAAEVSISGCLGLLRVAKKKQAGF